MANTADKQLESMIANMPEKTGKSLDAWVAIVKAAPYRKHGEIVKYLKADHGMTHGFANLVAQTSLKGDQPDEPADLVEAQYAGAKADLKPLYTALTDYLMSLGSDVELAPKKAYVSIRRSRQFALIQPSTKTRVDLGINLKGKALEGRLEASGSFNAMVSHRVRLEHVDEIDQEIKGWLAEAYASA